MTVSLFQPKRKKLKDSRVLGLGRSVMVWSLIPKQGFSSFLHNLPVRGSPEIRVISSEEKMSLGRRSEKLAPFAVMRYFL
ncbi:Uncharacterised protein [Chlamydia trachomatis]|nr:Uncharacterised protein [Chlamydia trachomatis]